MSVIDTFWYKLYRLILEYDNALLRKILGLKIETHTHFKGPRESKSTYRWRELQLKSFPVTLLKKLTSHQLCHLHWETTVNQHSQHTDASSNNQIKPRGEIRQRDLFRDLPWSRHSTHITRSHKHGPVMEAASCLCLWFNLNSFIYL